jgi:hypothetical protein
MKFGYMGDDHFRSFWISIIAGTAIFFGGLFVLSLVGIQYGEARILGTLAPVLIMLIGFLVAAYYISVFFTHHEVTEREVILRQGLAFRAVVPLNNVEHIEYTQETSPGMGIRHGHGGRFFLITAPSNMVEIRLKAPQRFYFLGVIPLWKTYRVFTNVDEPLKFIQEIEKKI